MKYLFKHNLMVIMMMLVSGSSYASASSSGLIMAKASDGGSAMEQGTWSGNTLTIGGSATASAIEVPYSNFFHYSTTQLLYTPEEIGKSGNISSIAFKVANAASHATTNVKVYLGHKSSAFASTSDYVTSSNLTLVYSGSPTLGSTTGWETLTFNQGTFRYNGTDNLVVVITRSATSYTNSLQYFCYTGSGYALYRRNDDEAGYGNVTNTSYAYWSSSNRPAIRMVFGADDGSVAINATNFPDVNFRYYLLSGSDGKDGVLTKNEIADITVMYVNNSRISSLKGIEYFTALAHLECDNNSLTSLDVSKNTALTYLSCNNNSLTSLDVSKNMALAHLECSNNSLTSLDVSKNPALTYLHCNNNSLTSLDVYKNTALDNLWCYNNQISGSNMDALINSLPTVAKGTHEINIIDVESSVENNVCTKSQVAAIREKGWSVYDANDNDYEGSDDDFSLGEDEFMAESVNGVPMVFKIISREAHTCQIGTGDRAAISTSTDGEVVLPKTANGYDVIAIAANAFAGTNIDGVTIPATIESIGEKAFANCALLDEVVSYIEHPFNIPVNVFSGIANYASLEIPYGTKADYLRKIGWGVFSSIWDDSVVVNGFCYFLPDDNNEDLYTAWVEEYPYNEYKSNIVIPETINVDGETFRVVGIMYSAFENSHIVSVAIPSTVRSIREDAFANCSDLGAIYSHITDVSSTFVDDCAFEGVSKAAVLYVPVGTVALYQAADVWKEFRNIVEMEEYDSGTDISGMENVIYAEPATALKGGDGTLTIAMKNAEATSGYSFDLVLPDGVTIDGYELSSRHNGHSEMMNYKEATGMYSFAVLSLQSKEIQGNDGAIWTLRLKVDDSVEEGTYAVKIKNAKYSLTSGATSVTMPETISLLTVEDYTKGDANGDMVLDIADAVCIVNHVVGKETPAFNAKGADANGDGEVDIADAVRIVNLVVGKIEALSRTRN